MRKLYESEWHGIKFTSFAKISSHKLADPAFYSSFYETFHSKYKSWEDLNDEWVAVKLVVNAFLKKHYNLPLDSRILSIGCGLGIIEKTLLDDGYNNLEIIEVSKEPLKWISSSISSDKIHVGFFPKCVPKNRVYDFIFLSGIEYCFNQEQLIDLLKSVHNYLCPGGICLLLSSSFEYKSNFKQQLTITIKGIVKMLLDEVGIRPRGQFWGYIRNRKEFHQAMTLASFSQIEDGIADEKICDTYWIDGKNKITA